MNNKRSAWILFSFMITFAILFTGCNPPATEEPAAPVDPAEEPIEEPPHPTDIELIETYS